MCCLVKDAPAPKSDQDALIVCMATRGQICFETELALQSNLSGLAHLRCFVGRRQVDDARNAIAKTVLNVLSQQPFPFTPREVFALWVDDDAWWFPNTLPVMLNAMHEYPKLDALFGKFGGRIPYSPVFAYRKADDRDSFPKEGVDCQMSEIVPIERAGFHFCLMRVSLLQRIGPDPFSPLGERKTTEDFAFCDRAVAIGATLGVGLGMPIVHLDPRDGSAYLPGMPAMMMDGNTVKSLSLQYATVASEIKTPEVRGYGSLGVAQELRSRELEARDRLQAEMERRRLVTATA